MVLIHKAADILKILYVLLVITGIGEISLNARKNAKNKKQSKKR